MVVANKVTTPCKKKKKKKEKRSSKKTQEKQTQEEVEAYLKAGESVGVALVVSSALWRRCHRKESRFPFAFSPPTLDPLSRCWRWW